MSLGSEHFREGKNRSTHFRSGTKSWKTKGSFLIQYFHFTPLVCNIIFSFFFYLEEGIFHTIFFVRFLVQIFWEFLGFGDKNILSGSCIQTNIGGHLRSVENTFFGDMHSSCLWCITIQSLSICELKRERDCEGFLSTAISSICEVVDFFAPAKRIVAIRTTIFVGVWSSCDFQAMLTNSHSWWLEKKISVLNFHTKILSFFSKNDIFLRKNQENKKLRK